MKYILILLTLISSPGLSQNINLKRSINWDKNKTLDYINVNKFKNVDQQIFYFKDASFEEDFFPYYTELINAEDYYPVEKIYIENTVYTPVNPEEHQKVPNLDLLPDELSFSYFIKYIQKKPYLDIKILPLRKNSASGTIEKLVSFTIKIEPGKVQESQSLRLKTTDGENSLFNNASVLSTGDWYKVKVNKTGIYKLTYDDLINMGVLNPADVRVYGNGGKVLPLMNNVFRKDDLLEIPVYMDKGSDSNFNSGDYILFYAEGPVTWQYDDNSKMFLHTIHGFSSFATYFVTSSFGQGKRIENAGSNNLPANRTVTSFDAYDYHEKNAFNLVESGRHWFGEEVSNNAYDTTFTFTNLVQSSPVKLKTSVLGRSSTNKTFSIKANNQNIENISTGSVSLNHPDGEQGSQSAKITSFNAASDKITISISFNKSTSSDKGWLDYIDINARRKLALAENILFFRDIESKGAGNVSEFIIENGTAQTLVWEITDINQVKNMVVNSNPQLSFKTSTETLKEFVAFNKNSSFLTPHYTKGANKVENQNLHSVQPHKLIIVAHPDYLPQAEKIGQFHREKDNFSVYVTTTEKIYNEFSSGMRDIAAIRDFVRMVYNRSGDDENAIKYLLLFGDGSYNNILDHKLNPNFIPTYQSENSISTTASYQSDDFYGFLEESEGGSENMERFGLDIGIGRLPVKDTSEASAMVRKILSYNTPESMLDWRNVLLFLGDDDGGYNGFMETSSNLGDSLMKKYPQFSVKKILFDAYERTTTSSGNRYPDITQSLIDNFNKGILTFNYIGHGGEKGLSHEYVITKEDISRLKNKFFPLFITATCEFSRFDWIAKNEDGSFSEETTAGETAILNPDGGAIALLTTTRVVYISDNDRLNISFYKYIFARDSNGNRYRLGDMVRETKIATGGRNQLNFTLLGDPALSLAYPEYYVKTDSVNGKALEEQSDTLKAFSKVTISGSIITRDSVEVNDFNGFVYPTILDKKQKMKTLGNSNNPLYTFETQENSIFHGKATVKDGKFTFSFVVPKDITYNVGNAKIIYYAENSVYDAHGYFSDIQIGGTSDNNYEDNNGPEIDLYMNDENFVSGGITDNNPVLFAKVRDENGINITTSGIGHDIVGIIDGDISNPIILNNYFQGTADDYRSGNVTYNLYDIEPGLHTLEVKVWDIFNNSSIASVDFNVREDGSMILESLINYPNPMRDYTRFQFEHNRPGIDQKITINIFDVSGRLVRTLEEKFYSTGYRSEPIEWDGRDDSGNKIPDGVYLYRLRVESSEGEFAEDFKKLIILN